MSRLFHRETQPDGLDPYATSSNTANTPTRMEPGLQQQLPRPPFSHHIAPLTADHRTEKLPEQQSLDVLINDTSRFSSREGSFSSSPRASMRRKSSNPSSPRSAGITAIPDVTDEEETETEDYDMYGESSSRMDGDSRRRNQSVASDQSRSSPLAKRLGETPPFMLPHPSKIDDTTSQMYPGVVLGKFAGSDSKASLGFGMDAMQFDTPLDDILDPSAAPRKEVRQGSTAGQVGATIAPWLMDDGPSQPDPLTLPKPTIPPRKGTRPRPDSRKHSMPALNHFASVPSLPKIRRHGKQETLQTNGSSSKIGSQAVPDSITGLSSSGSSTRERSRSQLASEESMQTVSTSKRSRKTPEQGDESFDPAGHPKARASRYGSTVSAMSNTGSTGSDKKKGFFGGLLKRKGGQSISQSWFFVLIFYLPVLTKVRYPQ